MRVLLPAPDGPERMMGRRSWSVAAVRVRLVASMVFFSRFIGRE